MIESLAPGEAIRVDLALVAAARGQDIEAAAATAYETFIGDGTNRFLPPPVSITPRVIWGSYRPVDPGPGVLMEIEPLGDDPVTPDDISYFSGLGSGAVVRQEVQPGVEQLVPDLFSAISGINRRDRSAGDGDSVKDDSVLR